MPTINKRFLLVLVLAVVVSGGALFAANALQTRRIPDALLRQSDRAAAANKPADAVRYLRQYLEFRPDDVDAQVRLTEMVRRKNPEPGGQAELIFVYEKILRLDPSRDSVRREALALSLALGHYSYAVPHAEALLKSHPTDADLWQQLAAGQAGLNQLPEARASYEAAVTHAPTVMRGYQRLAQFVWRNQNDPAGAKVVLDNMVAALPQEPEAHLVRARFRTYAVGDGGPGAEAEVQKAVADLQRVFELDPENPDAAFFLAEIYQKGRNVAAAHALLRDALAVNPKDVRLVRGLSWLELFRGNVPAAIAILDAGVRDIPDGFDLLAPLADLLVQQGDGDRARDILKRLDGRPALAMQSKYLKARLAMRDAMWADARGQLETLRREASGMPAFDAQLNLLLSTCHEKAGDLAAQEASLKRVTDADPSHVGARVALASVMLNAGRMEEAVKEYETACLSPLASGTVHAQLIRLKARRLRVTGGSPDEWLKVDELVARAAGRFPAADAEPVLLRAEMLSARGRKGDAVEVLKAETVRRPGDARVWVALANLTTEVGGTAAGLAALDEAQAAAGDGPEIRLARANLYVQDPARVRPLDSLMGRTESWPDVDQLQFYSGMVDVYDKAGDTAGVVRALRRVLARRPADAAVAMRLFERATLAHDARSANEARAALAKLDGDRSPAVAVCDALLATPATAAAATEKLIAVVGAEPTRGDACLALAHLSQLKGDTGRALALTERARQFEPMRFETNAAFLTQLYRAGQAKRFHAEVARFAADPRWAGDAFRRLVRSVADSLPPADALAVVKGVPTHARREPGATAWFADALAKYGAADECVDVLAVPCREPGANADDWLRLALRTPGADSRDVLASARNALPAPAFFALAASYRETRQAGDWRPDVRTPADRRADAQARMAVKLSRGSPTEAAAVLEEFLKATDQPAADVAWARRNLAMLLVSGGGKEADRQRALDLVTADRENKDAKPEDQRAAAVVLTTLARYLDGPDRKAVLAYAAGFLKAAHAASRSPRDLLNLSQVYQAAGMVAESRVALQTLITAAPTNRDYLVAALGSLTDAGDFATAAAFADQLLNHHRGDFRSVAAVARYEAKAGRPERSIALAEGYVRASEPTAGDFLTRSARVAELFDELARLPKVRGTAVGRRMADAAADRYTALVPTRPEAVVSLVGLLAADGRTAAAFERLDAVGRYVPARTRAAAGVAALRGGSATARQASLVRGWLDACLVDEPDSVALRLMDAEYYALRQEHEAARRGYEWVLDRDPHNPTALNNLAWVLAADPLSTARALELVGRAMREVGVTGELLDTRARVRLTANDLAGAARDQQEALSQARTPLRLFHAALLQMAQKPPRTDEARKLFREARENGLEPNGVHPADLPAYRSLDVPTELQ